MMTLIAIAAGTVALSWLTWTVLDIIATVASTPKVTRRNRR